MATKQRHIPRRRLAKLTEAVELYPTSVKTLRRRIAEGALTAYCTCVACTADREADQWWSGGDDE